MLKLLLPPTCSLISFFARGDHIVALEPILEFINNRRSGSSYTWWSYYCTTIDNNYIYLLSHHVHNILMNDQSHELKTDVSIDYLNILIKFVCLWLEYNPFLIPRCPLHVRLLCNGLWNESTSNTVSGYLLLSICTPGVTDRVATQECGREESQMHFSSAAWNRVFPRCSRKSIRMWTEWRTSGGSLSTACWNANGHWNLKLPVSLTCPANSVESKFFILLSLRSK